MTDVGRFGVEIDGRLVALNRAREGALVEARQIVRLAANSIRAVHRGEFVAARELSSEAGRLVLKLRHDLADYPLIYWMGYVQDAQKEYAEARLTAATIAGEPLPGPAELAVEDAPYLNALGETVGELRRHVLDLIRGGDLAQGERILTVMDDIFNLLVTIDYPDAITGSLRRTTDGVRAILERTRGDLTITLRQAALERALRLTRPTAEAQPLIVDPADEVDRP